MQVTITPFPEVGAPVGAHPSCRRCNYPIICCCLVAELFIFNTLFAQVAVGTELLLKRRHVFC